METAEVSLKPTGGRRGPVLTGEPAARAVDPSWPLSLSRGRCLVSILTAFSDKDAGRPRLGPPAPVTLGGTMHLVL